MTVPLQSSHDNLGEFSGRIAKLDMELGLLRIKVDFHNLRYLLEGNQIDFRSQMGSGKNCRAEILGKSNDYLLIKVPFFDECVKYVHFTVGAYLHLYSKDLAKNIQKGKEVLDLLLKKRISVESRKRKFQKKLTSYEERIEATNERYSVLRQKLEKELQGVIDDLDNDKIIAERNLKNAEIELKKIDRKLELYRVSDKNLEEDRWSLDPRLYYKK
ncbi:MAG: hypothetical protein OXB88_06025 [Bacteriovoracales bacterium]|nr:hypothetical protein [Bacteriovoracales bacterium]